jgi:hypothetical protein
MYPFSPLGSLFPPILNYQLDAGSLDRLKISSVAGDQGPLQAHPRSLGRRLSWYAMETTSLIMAASSGLPNMPKPCSKIVRAFGGAPTVPDPEGRVAMACSMNSWTEAI